MSNHVDKALSETDQAVDSGMDKALTIGNKANEKITGLIQSPEERKKAWGSAKESPLAYSFILFQLVVSFIPITTSAGFVGFATFCAAATTIAAFSVAFFIGLAVLIPVLAFTVPLAAFLWLCTVGTITVADWLYRNIYVDSGVQATVSKAADEVVQNYTEIEENAIREYENYKGRAIEGGQQVQERGSQLYRDVDRKGGELLTSAKERGGQMYRDADRKGGELLNGARDLASQANQKAIDGANRTADEVNSYAEAGQVKAGEYQSDAKQFKNDVKSNANGVKQEGKKLADQTKQSSQGVADAAKNDFRR